MKSSLPIVLLKKEKENSTSTTKIVPSIPKKKLFYLFDFTHSHQDLMMVLIRRIQIKTAQFYLQHGVCQAM